MLDNEPDLNPKTWSPELAAYNASILRHEVLRDINAPKVAILKAYITSKLEEIGRGNICIEVYFPEEVMWSDLAPFSASHVSEIHKI